MPRKGNKVPEPPTPNAPAAGGETPGSPAPTKAAAPTLDLAKYRQQAATQSAAAASAEESPQPSEPRGPKVKFADLAGLPGWRMKDPFNGVSDEFGPWWAGTVVAPDGATATAISSERSGPGASIKAAVAAGLFDDPKALVPIRVRCVESTKNFDPVTKHPYVRVLLTIG